MCVSLLDCELPAGITGSYSSPKAQHCAWNMYKLSKYSINEQPTSVCTSSIFVE